MVARSRTRSKGGLGDSALRRSDDGCHLRGGGEPVRRVLSIPIATLWNTGSSAFADDDDRDSFFKQLYSPTQLRDLAAPSARVLPGTSCTLNSEGAGNAGRPMRPIAACAMIVGECTRAGQVTPVSPGIPRAMVLTVSFVLSSATGLSCHRHPRALART